jgi:hypothetical protein
MRVCSRYGVRAAKPCRALLFALTVPDLTGLVEVKRQQAIDRPSELPGRDMRVSAQKCESPEVRVVS